MRHYAITINEEIVEVTVEYHVEPGQNGGRTDPSWEAYVEIEEVKDLSGNVLEVSDDELERLSERIMEDLDDDNAQAGADRAEEYENDKRDDECRQAFGCSWNEL